MNKPIDRGPVPYTKARRNDEFDLVAFRHMEFRRVENPDPARLKFYEKTIAATSASFFRKCKNLCMDSMIEVEDLKSYARVWTCNYIGLYELAEDTGDQNLKLLRTYLSQRFNELRNLLWKRGKNIFVHYDEAHIAFCGTPYNAQTRPGTSEAGEEETKNYKLSNYSNRLGTWFSTSETTSDEVDEDYIIKHRGYTSNSVQKRKENASKRLHEELNKLDHDKMIELLTEAKENLRIHPDAQKQAGEKLKEHAETCEKCKSLAIKENEQMARI